MVAHSWRPADRDADEEPILELWYASTVFSERMSHTCLSDYSQAEPSVVESDERAAGGYNAHFEQSTACTLGGNYAARNDTGVSTSQLTSGMNHAR